MQRDDPSQQREKLAKEGVGNKSNNVWEVPDRTLAHALETWVEKRLYGCMKLGGHPAGLEIEIGTCGSQWVAVACST